MITTFPLKCRHDRSSGALRSVSVDLWHSQAPWVQLEMRRDKRTAVPGYLGQYPGGHFGAIRR